MVFDWDEMKHDRNRVRRGLGFDYASLIFEGDVMERIDDRGEYGEMRVQAIGEVDGNVLFVVYTDRPDEVRWIISARRADRRERRLWRAR